MKEDSNIEDNETGIAIGGLRSTAKTKCYKGLAKTEDYGKSFATGDCGIAITERDGIAISGEQGVAISASCSKSKSKNGIAISGSCGDSFGYIAYSGWNGLSVAEDMGMAMSCRAGRAISGKCAVSFSGHKGYAASDIGGILVIRHYDGKKWALKVAKVGENGIEPNVIYSLNDQGEFVKVDDETLNEFNKQLNNLSKSIDNEII